MSRQTMFYISNPQSIERLAHYIIDMEFEVIERTIDIEQVSHFTHTPVKMEDIKGIEESCQLRLYKPNYGRIENIFSPHIELSIRRVNHAEKKIIRSRIYLCTSDFKEYAPEIVEQISSDYSKICKEICEIAPRKTVMMGEKKIINRMDDTSEELVRKGYSLVF